MPNPFSFNLAGQNIVVIGMGGIGGACTELAWRLGAENILGTKRQKAKANRLLREVRGKVSRDGYSSGGDLTPLGLDVIKRASLRRGIKAIEEWATEKGGIDLLIVTPGALELEEHRFKLRKEETDYPERATKRASDAAIEAEREAYRERAKTLPDERKRMFEQNLFGPMDLVEGLMPTLVGQDRPPCVTTICSVSNRLLLSGVQLYAETKATLETSTQYTGMHLERSRSVLGLEGGKAIPFVFGFALTDINREILLGTERGNRIQNLHPGRKYATIEEAATAIILTALTPYNNVTPVVITGGCTDNGGI